MTASTSNTGSFELTAIDGTNPLGFLSALGALVAARNSGDSDARLRWIRTRTWRPVLEDMATADRAELCRRLAVGLRGTEVSIDAARKRDIAEGAFARARTATKKEREKIKKEKLSREDRRKAFDERMCPLEEVASAKRDEWLVALKLAVPRPELALGARIDCTGAEYREHAEEFLRGGDGDSREALRYLAAFGSDACLEDRRGDLNERKIEATPFCFIRGSGHQDFLDFVLKLLETVTAERVFETLFEPWAYRDEGLSMRWDPSEDRRYALMDRDPTASDNKARTVWMANLLAYRSLALFPSAPTRGGLGTTGWTHVDGEPAFSWPLWEFAANPDTVQTMLQLRQIHEKRPDRAALDARGVAAVFRANRIRFPRTGASYKLNFSPARAV